MSKKQIHLLTFTLFLCLLCIPKATAQEAEAERLLQKGIESYNNLKFESAVQSLEEALRLGLPDKSKVEAYKHLGFAYIFKEQTPKAQVMFQKLLGIEPNYQLSPHISPKISQVFNEVKSQYAIKETPVSAQTADDDAKTLRERGITSYKEQQYDVALTNLKSAKSKKPSDGKTIFYLGLTYEAKEMFPQAIEEYKSYTELSRLSRMRKKIQDRVTWLTRQAIQQAARISLTQEVDLDVESIPQNTIAVMYFKNLGNNRELDPLQKGLTDMLITDISKAERLKVVERVRLQALLKEMQLGATGLVDQATAPRVGKLLGAYKIVNGGFTDLAGERMRIDAGMTVTPTAELDKEEGVSGALKNLFDLERELAFKIIEDSGIELTPVLIAAIGTLPTTSLAAFLAYSKGLDFMDRNSPNEAIQQFEEALNIDPNFTMARDRLSDAQALLNGMGTLAELEVFANSLDAFAAAVETETATSTTASVAAKGGGSAAKALLIGGAVVGAGAVAGGIAYTVFKKDKFEGTVIGKDDDGDGLVDEESFDHVDNDGDGLIDEDLKRSSDDPVVDWVRLTPDHGNESTMVLLEAKVSDPNGIDDIKSVEYVTDTGYRNPSIRINDEGEAGDKKAGDGIFSTQAPSGADKTTKLWVTATDYAGHTGTNSATFRYERGAPAREQEPLLPQDGAFQAPTAPSGAFSISQGRYGQIGNSQSRLSLRYKYGSLGYVSLYCRTPMNEDINHGRGARYGVNIEQDFVLAESQTGGFYLSMNNQSSLQSRLRYRNRLSENLSAQLSFSHFKSSEINPSGLTTSETQRRSTQTANMQLISDNYDVHIGAAQSIMANFDKERNLYMAFSLRNQSICERYISLDISGEMSRRDYQSATNSANVTLSTAQMPIRSNLRLSMKGGIGYNKWEDTTRYIEAFVLPSLYWKTSSQGFISLSPYLGLRQDRRGNGETHLYYNLFPQLRILQPLDASYSLFLNLTGFDPYHRSYKTLFSITNNRVLSRRLIQ